MEAVDLTFNYTQSEYVKAERQYLFASKTITKANIFIIGAVLLFTLFYLFFSSFSPLSIIVLVLAVLVVFICCTLYFFIPVKKFKDTSKYHEEYSLHFSNDGIKFKTPTIDSALQWDIYSGLWENDDFYFLIQAPRLYTLLPKRAFQSEEERQAFEEMALSQLKCEKRMV